ncbi:MAG TPA: peptide MFS transporter [Opitutaceae bacterium]|nr:peptide MFS transporter [Opitutaceae bacterium]
MSFSPASRSPDNPDPVAAVPGAGDTGGIGGHPRGLTTLFLTEMWERFSYYGMRALLMLFMVKTAADGGMGFDTKKAATIYGTYTMSVYLLSILGGFIADNFIGARRAVLWGGSIIACGHFAMAIGSTATFFSGLVLIALGTGLLKPNISSMVGSLYHPSDVRRDAGFSIFYMGINIGAFLSPLVTGYLAQSSGWKNQLASWGMDPAHSWHWGFGAAGVGMTIGLVVYVLQRERLAQVGNTPAPDASGSRPWGKMGLVALGSIALIAAMRASDSHPFIVYVIFAIQIAAVLFFAFRPDPDSKRIAAILIFFIAAEIFWAIFEQAGSTVSLFADQLTRNEIFGRTFPSSWWQSANPVWVILLAPVFALLWIKLGTRQPSSPMKFVLGLFFVGLSFVLMIPAAKLTADGKIGPLWLVGLFFLQTVGEMLLSPVGLSTMTKLAPQRLVGLVMGIWFLAAALGNKLAGVLAGEFKSDNPAELATFFWHQALWVGVATLALLALVPWVKKLMGGVR